MNCIFKNRLNRKLLSKLVVSTIVADLLLVSGTMTVQASAEEVSNVGHLSQFNWQFNKSRAHKYHIKKVAFIVGTSSVYSHANLLPKTERFFRPVVATKAIFGNGGSVCTLSGLGHRSACGAHLL